MFRRAGTTPNARIFNLGTVDIMTAHFRYSNAIGTPASDDAAPEVFGVALPLDTPSLIATAQGPVYELVEARGVRHSPDLTLTVQHDRTRPVARIGRSLTLAYASDAIHLRAQLSDTAESRDVRTLIRDGVLTGLSVEMIVHRESWGQHDGQPLRRIESATITRISVVDTPAYQEATVDARAQHLVQAPAPRNTTSCGGALWLE